MDENLIPQNIGSFLKGAAIIMIIIQHIGQAFKIGFVNPLGPIGVFLFLFMSGYGLTCSYKKDGRAWYFRKRILKVYGLYLVSLLLFLVIHFIMFKMTFVAHKVFKYALLLDYPQGSHWYLSLIFLWYAIFYLYTFCIGTKAENIGLVVATILVLLIMGGNRSVVWQMFSFQLGVISALHGSKIREWVTPHKKWGGVLLAVVAVVAVAFKKSYYVETHELGAIDMFLQIILTLTIGFLFVDFSDALIRIPGIRVIEIIGDISYELYLAHVILLDWLEGLPKESVFIEYIGISLCICVLLIIFRKFVIERILRDAKKKEQKR